MLTPSKRYALAAFFFAQASLSLNAAPAGMLSSPMVDTTMYREGEVKRLSGVFGDWHVVCDEITRLRQRFCSLKTGLVSTEFGTVGAVDMSTGDDGRPVALLHLPLGVVVPSGVEVLMTSKAAPSNKARRGETRPLQPRRVAIAVCDSTQCLAIWNLNAAEMAALQGTDKLHLRYRLIRSFTAAPVSLVPTSGQTQVEATISPVGFASAIKATLQ